MTKKQISERPEVFQEIPSVQLSALKIKTYQTTVKISGIIKISFPSTIVENVSSSITHQNTLLT